jgi:glycerol-3-phosphate acyltransferase PlsY
VVNQNLGSSYGCLTAVLDLLKVAVPTLLVYLLQNDEPFYLLTALTGLIGHNYPLYHRFRGGRGESPMIGAMLVINWFGIIISNAAALIIGYLTGSVLVSRYGWYILMIIWYWYYFDSFWYVAFMIGANILFWLAMMPDLKRYAVLKKENDLDVSEETVSEFLLMGRGFGRFLDNYGLPALLKKLFSR